MRISKLHPNLIVLCIAGFLAGGSTSVSARDMERALLGAWATSASDCAKLFERRRVDRVYRKPVDEFSQAAIIEPAEFSVPRKPGR